MSMNLIFFVKNSSGAVDFPFQTPTSLTHAVLNLESEEKRIALIQEYLDNHVTNEEYRQQLMEEIKALMKSPGLELSMI